MKKLSFLLMLLFGVILTNCRPKPIDIDVKPAESKLVITAQVIPGSVMIVGLTRSFSALSPGGNEDTIQNNFLDSVLVANAVVTVEHSSQIDTLYMITPGIYASLNVLLVDFNTYTVHAYDPGTGQSVSATTQLLPQEHFDTIWPYKGVLSGFPDSVVYAHYELTDFANSEDYYVACYYKKSSDTSAFDVNAFFSQGTNELSGFDIFSDRDFDQNGHLTRDQYLPYVGLHDTIACTIAHITKGYYEFLDAYKRSSSLFNQLSGEPINYPSNVEGGYGYFATEYPDIRFFDMNQY